MNYKKTILFSLLLLGIIQTYTAQAYYPYNTEDEKPTIYTPETTEIQFDLNTIITRDNDRLLRFNIVLLARKDLMHAWEYIKALWYMHQQQENGFVGRDGKKLSGGGVYQLIQTALEKPILQQFTRDILDLVADSYQPCRHIDKVLFLLKKKGYRIVIISGKDEISYTDAMNALNLKGIDLEQYFDAVLLYRPSKSCIMHDMKKFLAHAEHQTAFFQTVQRALTRNPSSKIHYSPYSRTEEGFVKQEMNLAQKEKIILFDKNPEGSWAMLAYGNDALSNNVFCSTVKSTWNIIHTLYYNQKIFTRNDYDVLDALPWQYNYYTRY
ncbi:MAG TPA: hypothetical protein VEK38_04045 [Candidatus Bathyarchaeia archaeon]|nr:hypothetical protein [Candidatus Bathyarchaeia archaeon]